MFLVRLLLPVQWLLTEWLHCMGHARRAGAPPSKGELILLARIWRDTDL